MIEERQRIYGKTEVFRVSAGQFISLLIRQVGWRWLIVPSIAVVVLVVAAIALAEVRLAILAMMMLFIIVPMIMALLYINYGLSGNCYINVIDHEIIFSEKEIIIQTFHIRNPEEENPEKEIKRHIVEWETIKDIQYGLKHILLIISHPRFGFLYIPLSAFPESSSNPTAITFITKKFNAEFSKLL